MSQIFALRTNFALLPWAESAEASSIGYVEKSEVMRDMVLSSFDTPFGSTAALILMYSAAMSITAEKYTDVSKNIVRDPLTAFINRSLLDFVLGSGIADVLVKRICPDFW